MPSWIRSSSDSSWPWYFLAIETTRRRFELIIRSLASRSPCSIRLASSTSSVGGEQRVAADLVEEELERVGGGAGQLAVAERRGLDALPAAVVGDVDALALEVGLEAVHVLRHRPRSTAAARRARRGWRIRAPPPGTRTPPPRGARSDLGPTTRRMLRRGRAPCQRAERSPIVIGRADPAGGVVHHLEPLLETRDREHALHGIGPADDHHRRRPRGARSSAVTRQRRPVESRKTTLGQVDHDRLRVARLHPVELVLELGRAGEVEFPPERHVHESVAVLGSDVEDLHWAGRYRVARLDGSPARPASW